MICFPFTQWTREGERDACDEDGWSAAIFSLSVAASLARSTMQPGRPLAHSSRRTHGEASHTASSDMGAALSLSLATPGPRAWTQKVPRSVPLCSPPCPLCSLPQRARPPAIVFGVVSSPLPRAHLAAGSFVWRATKATCKDRLFSQRRGDDEKESERWRSRFDEHATQGRSDKDMEREGKARAERGP